MTPTEEPSNANSAASRLFSSATLPLVAFLLAASISRLWLGSAIPLSLYDADADDALHARQTAALLDGRWLGDYDEYTLVKGPGFALFLASARGVGLSRRCAEDLLAIFAGLILVAAVRAHGLPRSLSGAAFALTIFHPATMGMVADRLIRDGVHASQTLIIVALIALLAAPSSRRSTIVCSVALGVIAAWSSLTRAEAAWLWCLAPFALWAWTAGRRARGRSSLGAITCALALFLPAAALPPLAGRVIRHVNEARYGAPIVNEIADSAFDGAMAALRRVALARWRRYEPLDADARKALAEVSPAFAEVAPHFASNAFRAPAHRAGADRMMIFAGWTLREAAARAGHHATLPQARAFYLRLADEVNRAVDEGRIDGVGRQRSQTPLLHRSLFVRCGKTFLREVASAWRLDDDVLLLPRLPRQAVADDLRADYVFAVGEPRPNDNSEIVGAAAVRLRLRDLLELIFGAAPVLGLLATVTQFALLRRRRFDGLMALESLLCAAWIGRAALVAVLETYWFRDVAPYRTPIHAAFPAWLVLSLHAYLRFARRRPSADRFATWTTRRRATAPLVALIIVVAWTSTATWFCRERRGEVIAFDDLSPALAPNDAIVTATRGAADLREGRIEFAPRSTADRLGWHLVRPREATDCDLVVEGSMPEVEYGNGLEIDSLDGLARRRNFIFCRGEPRTAWRVPLAGVSIENLELFDPEGVGTRIVVESLRFEPRRPAPTFSADATRIEARLVDDGELELVVGDGERGSLYAFVLARARLIVPGRLDGRTGATWLDATTALNDANGRPLLFRVATDDDGNGRRRHALPDAIDLTVAWFVQGVGLEHLTPCVWLER